jgi:hypothetical protein
LQREWPFIGLGTILETIPAKTEPKGIVGPTKGHQQRR